MSSGKKAESFVEDYLQNNGYKVLDRNWKNQYAEIDIIAVKDKTLHFIEVKYRKNGFAGSAEAYLTKKKINQVRFAARLWLKDNDWNGPTQIDGVAITGSLKKTNLKHYSNI